MAPQLGHLTGIHISLISHPFALPPQDSQLVSSPLGAPADLFTDHDQTPGDWPTVRLCLFTLQARVCTSELSHKSQGVGLWGSQSQGPGESQVHEAELKSLRIYGESANSRGMMGRGGVDQPLQSDLHDSSHCQKSGVTPYINIGNKIVKSKYLHST